MEQQHDPSRELATSAPKSDGEIEAIKRYLGWIGVLLQTHFDQFSPSFDAVIVQAHWAVRTPDPRALAYRGRQLMA